VSIVINSYNKTNEMH